MPFCIKCHHRLYPFEESQDPEVCASCRKKQREDKIQKLEWENSTITQEKLIMMSISDGCYTGDIYKKYKELCEYHQQKILTRRRVTQILCKIELDGKLIGDSKSKLIGTIEHHGIYGRTKKWELLNE